MLARLLAMALCLSRCLFVTTHKSMFCRNAQTDRAGFWDVSFFRPVLHWLFLRVDNFVTVSGKKVCDMSIVYKFCLEKHNLDASEIN